MNERFSVGEIVTSKLNSVTQYTVLADDGENLKIKSTSGGFEFNVPVKDREVIVRVDELNRSLEVIDSLDKEINDGMFKVNVFFNDLTDEAKTTLVKKWNEIENTDWTVDNFNDECIMGNMIAEGVFERDTRG
jgi:hypothetical protein